MEGGESHIYLGEQFASPVPLALATGKALVFSSKYPGKEKANEDGAAIFTFGNGTGVMVVADGAGGQPQGAKAAELAIKSMRDAIEAGRTSGQALRSSILDGFDRANKAVLELGVGAGTTLIVAAIDGEEMRTFHVGDSSALVVGQRGKMKLLTMSHSPVGYQVEAGVLDPKDALHHEDLNMVSNLVGTSEMRIEIGPLVKLASRDTLVMGSDGLFDNLHAHEIGEMVRTGPVETGATRLRKKCEDRMINPVEGQPSKPDDLTFVVFRRG